MVHDIIVEFANCSANALHRACVCKVAIGAHTTIVLFIIKSILSSVQFSFVLYMCVM